MKAKFFKRSLWNERAFSIVEVLVSASLGLIVLGALSFTMSHLGVQLREMKKETEWQVLSRQIQESLLTQCKEVLTNSANVEKLLNGEEIEFNVLKDSRSSLVDLSSEEKLQAYGLYGHTNFRLSCADSSEGACKCNSGSTPPPLFQKLAFFPLQHVQNQQCSPV